MKNIFGIDVSGGHVFRILFIHISAKDVEVVTEDGAPSGKKDFVIWDLVPVNPKSTSTRTQSPMAEATGLMRFLMKRGIRVILFCKVCLFWLWNNEY